MTISPCSLRILLCLFVAALLSNISHAQSIRTEPLLNFSVSDLSSEDDELMPLLRDALGVTDSDNRLFMDVVIFDADESAPMPESGYFIVERSPRVNMPGKFTVVIFVTWSHIEAEQQITFTEIDYAIANESSQALFAKGAVLSSHPAVPVSKRQDGFEALVTSANAGNRTAAYFLGYLFESGEQGFSIDPGKAEQYYLQAAGEQYTEALLGLGRLYYFEIYGQQDLAQAVDFFTQAAEFGNGESAYNLGVMHLEGEFFEQDYAEAIFWLEQAAALGHPDAALNLGVIFGFTEDYSFPDGEKAVEWLRIAASSDIPEAHFALGEAYRDGIGVEPDLQQFRDWMLTSAHLGHGGGQFLTGEIYENGEIVDRDYETAAFWYSQADASDISQAGLRLGDMYYEGHGVPQDFSRAHELYLRSANFGVVEAMYRLVDNFERGIGVNQNFDNAMWWFIYAHAKVGDEAIQWYEKNQGEFSAEMYIRLANAYMTTEYPDQDFATAYRLNLRAAEMGRTDAMVRLANHYLAGNGVPRDTDQAIHWHIQAAGQGFAESAYLGAKLILDTAPEPDSEEYALAKELLSQASYEGLPVAEVVLNNLMKMQQLDLGRIHRVNTLQIASTLGDAQAMYRMSMKYFLGEDVPVDLTEAYKFAKMAAEYGMPGAQLQAAMHLMTGLGTETSQVEAYMWLELAARQNEVMQLNQKVALANRMTAEEINEAMRLVDAFVPKSDVPDSNAP